MPHVSVEVSALSEDVGAQPDAGVREREQRQDDVGDVRRVCRLQPLVDRDRLAQAVGGGTRVLGVGRLPEGAREVERVLDIPPVRPVHRHEQRDRDARERRVHARREEREPHDDRQRRVDRTAPAAEVAGEVHADQADGGDDEGERVEVLGVDQGDDAEGADVVDDGESEEEDAQATGHPRADQGERADEERRVGRDHHAPRLGLPGVRGDGHEQQRRDRQTCDGSDHRHDRPRPAGELADRELAAHLEPDREEEDRHQRVVDEGVQREVELKVADADGEVGLPERLVREAGDVRPDDRDKGREQEQKRADAVLAHRADLLGDRTATAGARLDLLRIG